MAEVMKKSAEATQTLLAGCSKAQLNIFACHRPPSRGCGMTKI